MLSVMSKNPGILGIPSTISFHLDLTLDRGNRGYCYHPLSGGTCSTLQLQPSQLVR